ncbi:aldo/keto reductase [Limosilactobacillus vaginalis]|uniref:Aldo/keto reductase n=1 Tax=Limosilactobacillus vaginalis TaxID=1633 RepID=A0AAW5WRS7_9LACO|nr:aldo/keto reductase [Limosilactobacillus vaginalis]MCZ3667138.1 aldo/keto reductase [Limosilactobacillus vaginalis]
MPQIGFGVWKIPFNQTAKVVTDAIKNHYRLIDTAKQYGNEEQVGQGIKDSGIERKQLFLTTKIFNGDQGDFDKLRNAFNEQLKKLGTDHVVLLLLHWPVFNKYIESWRALEAIYNDGQARAIGVCNFDVDHLQKLMDHANIMPMVNQIEFNPRIHQPDTVAFCQDNHIQLEAWSPLGNGQLLSSPVISKIAKEHGKTPAQVIIRWELQQGFIVIPKSIHEERMRENRDVYDFELDADEMEAIAMLDEEKHSIWYDKYKWSGNPNGRDNYIAKPGEF